MTIDGIFNKWEICKITAGDNNNWCTSHQYNVKKPISNNQ